MTSPLCSDPAKAMDLAINLQRATGKLLSERMGIRADLSRQLFLDIAVNWFRDFDRIKLDETKGVRPARLIAYLMFWIRKVKPVSAAYREADIRAALSSGRAVPSSKEIIDINERVAILLAFEFLADYAKGKSIIVYDASQGMDRPYVYDRARFDAAVDRYLNQRLGSDGKSALQTLIRDMRYKAFGPHNLVHLMDQFVFRLVSE